MYVCVCVCVCMCVCECVWLWMWVWVSVCKVWVHMCVCCECRCTQATELIWGLLEVASFLSSLPLQWDTGINSSLRAPKTFTHWSKHLALRFFQFSSSLIPLKKILFIFMSMSTLSARTPACQKRVSDPITDGCEPPCNCWELNSGPLEEQVVLLTTEPSL